LLLLLQLQLQLQLLQLWLFTSIKKNTHPTLHETLNPV